MKNQEEEIWKDIIGYEGLYKVSSYGKILSNKRNGCLGGIIIPQVIKGYFSIKLSKHNKVVRYPIHKLVADSFVNKPVFYECINHIDGNKKNNYYKNLEFVTIKENVRHAWRIGLCESVREKMRIYSTGRSGELSAVSKAVIQINKKDLSVINEFVSVTEASINTGAIRQHISKCCSGERRSTGGYFWKYK